MIVLDYYVTKVVLNQKVIFLSCIIYKLVYLKFYTYNFV